MYICLILNNNDLIIGEKVYAEHDEITLKNPRRVLKTSQGAYMIVPFVDTNLLPKSKEVIFKVYNVTGIFIPNVYLSNLYAEEVQDDI